MGPYLSAGPEQPFIAYLGTKPVGCVSRRLARESALHQIRTEGVKAIELGVDANNLPALKLYRRFGFDVCKTHFYILVPCVG